MVKNSQLSVDEQLELLALTVDNIYAVFQDTESGLVMEMVAVLEDRMVNDNHGKVLETLQHMKHMFNHLCSMENNPVTEYAAERFEMVALAIVNAFEQSSTTTNIV